MTASFVQPAHTFVGAAMQTVSQPAFFIAPAVALMYSLSTSGRFSRIGYNGDDNGTLRNVTLADFHLRYVLPLLKSRPL